MGCFFGLGEKSDLLLDHGDLRFRLEVDFSIEGFIESSMLSLDAGGEVMRELF